MNNNSDDAVSECNRIPVWWCLLAVYLVFFRQNMLIFMDLCVFPILTRILPAISNGSKLKLREMELIKMCVDASFLMYHFPSIPLTQLENRFYQSLFNNCFIL